MQGFNMGRYVPPDVEGTISANALHRKHPLGSRASTPGALTVRFEMPFATWCATCAPPTLIPQGARFNAAKRRVGAYHSTPIFSFTFRHQACGGEVEVRTDPKNTAYVVTRGGTKRDTGEDKVREGDVVVILTDREREEKRKSAFASLERTIEDRAALQQATQRIDGLLDISARQWDDPYTQNQKLRRAFRKGRHEREAAAKSDDALRERMSLGIDLVPATEEDAVRASLVDFGEDNDGGRDKALSKPLFGKTSTKASSRATLKADEAKAERKEGLVSELVGNTRAAKDPFLLANQTAESRGPARIPGVKRRRVVEAGEETPSKTVVMEESTTSNGAGLVNYDSD